MSNFTAWIIGDIIAIAIFGAFAMVAYEAAEFFMWAVS